MASSPTEPAKVSVLFIGSAPKDRGEVDLTREVEALTRELEIWAPGCFELVARWGVPATELLDLLERYTPDVLHFGGHGLRSGELAFEDEHGDTHAPAPEAIARVFEHYEGHVRCVVLNACHTEDQARLIAAHVEIVVAMSDEIYDATARAFARVFYKELGKDKSVAKAFAGAKLDLELRGSPDQDVLVLCPGSGVDPAEVFLSRPGAALPSLAAGPADTVVGLKSELEERALAGADVSDLEEQLRELRRQIRSGPQLDSGAVLGERYRLATVLGTGGFATVWKAFDRAQNKLVAVKVLHGQWARDESRVERFVSGAKRLEELRHERVVSVIESPSPGGQHVYCVMPLLEGGDLRRAMLGEQKLDRRSALSVIADALEGLAFAHERGVIHRDVKPGNILLDGEGRGYMTDFDLAHAKDSTQGTRTVGMGTFGYAAPEQQRDAKRVDERADVYGAGMCVLFALRREDPPVFVARLEPELLDGLECGEGLRVAVKRAVAYEAGERASSCAELVSALRGEIDGLDQRGRQAPPSREDEPREVAVDVEWTEDGDWASLRVGDVVQRMRLIQPGRFLMGSPEDEPGRREVEGPQHEVRLSEGYWLAETPCTQALWEVVMGANPSRFQSPGRPVERVSWEDVQAFLDRLNGELVGGGLVLPTEAQWEYACRGGTSAATYAGPMEILGENNAAVLDEIAWYGGNSGVGYDLEDGEDSSTWEEKQHEHVLAGTREVGHKRANGWGLHDMLGNVWEWCADGGRTYEDALVVDPVGALDGPGRVYRGGGWAPSSRRPSGVPLLAPPRLPLRRPGLSACSRSGRRSQAGREGNEQGRGSRGGGPSQRPAGVGGRTFEFSHRSLEA